MSAFNHAFDARFRRHWPSYLLQCFFATASVFIVLIALRQQNLIVAASLAATALTIFVMPNRVTASTRNVVGGHLVGLSVGSLFALVPVHSAMVQDSVYAIAVGGAMLVMAITNTEHSPAAGTALGVVTTGFSLQVVLGVLVGVGVLAVIHRLLQPILRDLIQVAERKTKPNNAV